MSEAIGYLFAAILSCAGYIAVAYYQRKAENEKRKRINNEYEAHKQRLEAQIRSKALPDLVRNANERLGKRRSGND